MIIFCDCPAQHAQLNSASIFGYIDAGWVYKGLAVYLSLILQHK